MEALSEEKQADQTFTPERPLKPLKRENAEADNSQLLAALNRTMSELIAVIRHTLSGPTKSQKQKTIPKKAKAAKRQALTNKPAAAKSKPAAKAAKPSRAAKKPVSKTTARRASTKAIASKKPGKRATKHR